MYEGCEEVKKTYKMYWQNECERERERERERFKLKERDLKMRKGVK